MRYLGLRKSLVYRTFFGFFKVEGLFAGGLYLLGFGWFHGLNAKGMFDVLLPYEWFGCSVLGFCFLFWSCLSCLVLWRFLKNV